jgi:hypothetical protein
MTHLRTTAPWTLIALSLLYLVSFGPACGMLDHALLSPKLVAFTYRPLLFLAYKAPAIISRPLCLYANIATRQNSFVLESLWLTAEIVDESTPPPNPTDVLQRASVL